MINNLIYILSTIKEMDYELAIKHATLMRYLKNVSMERDLNINLQQINLIFNFLKLSSVNGKDSLLLLGCAEWLEAIQQEEGKQKD